jgi:hypothetical protein
MALPAEPLFLSVGRTTIFADHTSILSKLFFVGKLVFKKEIAWLWPIAIFNSERIKRGWSSLKSPLQKAYNSASHDKESP